MTPKKRKPLNPRQAKLLRERAKGKTYAQAALAAGYSAKNPKQSGIQAMNQMRGRVQNLMEQNGLDENSLISKYLLPLMKAEEAIYFQNAGKVTDERKVKALSIRLNALKEAFRLHGSYAPRDPKEAAQYGMKIIIADIPGPPGEFNQFIDVVPPKHPKNYGSLWQRKQAEGMKRPGQQRLTVVRLSWRDACKLIDEHPFTNVPAGNQC